MHAADKLAMIVQEVTTLLDSSEAAESKVPLGKWEDRFKKLKGIRGFFGQPWDQIERQIKASNYPEEWIWESRKDEAFKKYYMLRTQADKLEVLLK